MPRTVLPIRLISAMFLRRRIDGGHHQWIRLQYNVISLNWGDGPAQTYVEPLCGGRAINSTITPGAVGSITERFEVYNELRVYDTVPFPKTNIGYDLTNAAADAPYTRQGPGTGFMGIAGTGATLRLDMAVRKNYAVFIRQVADGKELWIREPYNIVSLNWGNGSQLVDGVQVTGEQTYVEPTCGQHMSKLEREEVYDGLRFYDSPPFPKTRIGYGNPGQ